MVPVSEIMSGWEGVTGAAFDAGGGETVSLQALTRNRPAVRSQGSNRERMSILL
jgi:hypothetical protein